MPFFLSSGASDDLPFLAHDSNSSFDSFRTPLTRVDGVQTGMAAWLVCASSKSAVFSFQKSICLDFTLHPDITDSKFGEIVAFDVLASRHR